MDVGKTLNTDGKTTFNILKEKLNVVNEKIDYEDDEHRFCFSNKAPLFSTRYLSLFFLSRFYFTDL